MSLTDTRNLVRKCLAQIVPCVAVFLTNRKVKKRQDDPSLYQAYLGYSPDLLRRRLDQEHTRCGQLEDRADRLAALMAGANVVTVVATTLVTMENGGDAWEQRLFLAFVVAAAVNVLIAWWLAVHTANKVKMIYGTGTPLEAMQNDDLIAESTWQIAESVWKQEQQNLMLTNVRHSALTHFRNGLLFASMAAILHLWNIL